MHQLIDVLFRALNIVWSTDALTVVQQLVARLLA
jgi:hypothetical protein